MLDALQQRLSKYREAGIQARGSGDERKARMHERIAKVGPWLCSLLPYVSLSLSLPLWSLQNVACHRSLPFFPCSNIKMPFEHFKQDVKLILLSCLFLQVSAWPRVYEVVSEQVGGGGA